MGCKTEPLRSPRTSNFSREAEFETVGTGIENVLAGFAVRIKTADLDDITSSGKKGRYQFRLPIQTAIRQCQETTLQIYQKEVEIVRYGISAWPHARDVQTQGHGPAADIENILVGGLRQVCTAPRERIHLARHRFGSGNGLRKGIRNRGDRPGNVVDPALPCDLLDAEGFRGVVLQLWRTAAGNLKRS